MKLIVNYKSIKHILMSNVFFPPAYLFCIAENKETDFFQHYIYSWLLYFSKQKFCSCLVSFILHVALWFALKSLKVNGKEKRKGKIFYFESVQSAVYFGYLMLAFTLYIFTKFQKENNKNEIVFNAVTQLAEQLFYTPGK